MLEVTSRLIPATSLANFTEAKLVSKWTSAGLKVTITAVNAFPVIAFARSRVSLEFRNLDMLLSPPARILWQRLAIGRAWSGPRGSSDGESVVGVVPLK